MKRITRRSTAILLILVLAGLLFGCGQKESGIGSGSYPAMQLKKPPEVYNNEFPGKSCVITAPNYYGDAVVGGTFMFAGSALWENDPARPTEAGEQGGKKYLKSDDGYRYPVFITSDGTLTLEAVFKEGDSAEFQSAVFKTNQSGNDITFTPGTPVKCNRESTQKVSGIFAIETLGVYFTEPTVTNKQRSQFWGIVLSQKQVDEFFATGKIADYDGFDFNGLNDLSLNVGETEQTTKPSTVKVQKTPKVYTKDPWGDGSSLVITAPNYYGDAVIGETYTVSDSALSNTNAVGGFTSLSDDFGYGYQLFITADGTLDIEFAFEKGDEGTPSEYQSSVFTTKRDGNNVTFETGTPIEQHSNNFAQSVSGFFAVEVMGVREIGGANRTTNDMLWGIVLSQKQVDEFFATGQIANYSGFDFSGLNDTISIQ